MAISPNDPSNELVRNALSRLDDGGLLGFSRTSQNSISAMFNDARPGDKVYATTMNIKQSEIADSIRGAARRGVQIRFSNNRDDGVNIRLNEKNITQYQYAFGYLQSDSGEKIKTNFSRYPHVKGVSRNDKTLLSTANFTTSAGSDYNVDLLFKTNSRLGSQAREAIRFLTGETRAYVPPKGANIVLMGRTQDNFPMEYQKVGAAFIANTKGTLHVTSANLAANSYEAAELVNEAKKGRQVVLYVNSKKHVGAGELEATDKEVKQAREIKRLAGEEFQDNIKIRIVKDGARDSEGNEVQAIHANLLIALSAEGNSAGQYRTARMHQDPVGANTTEMVATLAGKEGSEVSRFNEKIVRDLVSITEEDTYRYIRPTVDPDIERIRPFIGYLDYFSRNSSRSKDPGDEGPIYSIDPAGLVKARDYALDRGMSVAAAEAGLYPGLTESIYRLAILESSRGTVWLNRDDPSLAPLRAFDVATQQRTSGQKDWTPGALAYSAALIAAGTNFLMFSGDFSKEGIRAFQGAVFAPNYLGQPSMEVNSSTRHPIRRVTDFFTDSRPMAVMSRAMRSSLGAFALVGALAYGTLDTLSRYYGESATRQLGERGPIDSILIRVARQVDNSNTEMMRQVDFTAKPVTHFQDMTSAFTDTLSSLTLNIGVYYGFTIPLLSIMSEGRDVMYKMASEAKPSGPGMGRVLNAALATTSFLGQAISTTASFLLRNVVIPSMRELTLFDDKLIKTLEKVEQSFAGGKRTESIEKWVAPSFLKSSLVAHTEVDKYLAEKNILTRVISSQGVGAIFENFGIKFFKTQTLNVLEGITNLGRDLRYMTAGGRAGRQEISELLAEIEAIDQSAATTPLSADDARTKRELIARINTSLRNTGIRTMGGDSSEAKALEHLQRNLELEELKITEKHATLLGGESLDDFHARVSASPATILDPDQASDYAEFKKDYDRLSVTRELSRHKTVNVAKEIRDKSAFQFLRNSTYKFFQTSRYALAGALGIDPQSRIGVRTLAGAGFRGFFAVSGAAVILNSLIADAGSAQRSSVMMQVQAQKMLDSALQKANRDPINMEFTAGYPSFFDSWNPVVKPFGQAAAYVGYTAQKIAHFSNASLGIFGNLASGLALGGAAALVMAGLGIAGASTALVAGLALGAAVGIGSHLYFKKSNAASIKSGPGQYSQVLASARAADIIAGEKNLSFTDALLAYDASFSSMGNQAVEKINVANLLLTTAMFAPGPNKQEYKGRVMESYAIQASPMSAILGALTVSASRLNTLWTFGFTYQGPVMLKVGLSVMSPIALKEGDTKDEKNKDGSPVSLAQQLFSSNSRFVYAPGNTLESYLRLAMPAAVATLATLPFNHVALSRGQLIRDISVFGSSLGGGNADDYINAGNRRADAFISSRPYGGLIRASVAIDETMPSLRKAGNLAKFVSAIPTIGPRAAFGVIQLAPAALLGLAQGLVLKSSGLRWDQVFSVIRYSEIGEIRKRAATELLNQAADASSVSPNRLTSWFANHIFGYDTWGAAKSDEIERLLNPETQRKINSAKTKRNAGAAQIDEAAATRAAEFRSFKQQAALRSYYKRSAIATRIARTAGTTALAIGGVATASFVGYFASRSPDRAAATANAFQRYFSSWGSSGEDTLFNRISSGIGLLIANTIMPYNMETHPSMSAYVQRIGISEAYAHLIKKKSEPVSAHTYAERLISDLKSIYFQNYMEVPNVFVGSALGITVSDAGMNETVSNSGFVQPSLGFLAVSKAVSLIGIQRLSSLNEFSRNMAHVLTNESDITAIRRTRIKRKPAVIGKLFHSGSGISSLGASAKRELQARYAETQWLLNNNQGIDASIYNSFINSRSLGPENSPLSFKYLPRSQANWQITYQKGGSSSIRASQLGRQYSSIVQSSRVSADFMEIDITGEDAYDITDTQPAGQNPDMFGFSKLFSSSSLYNSLETGAFASLTIASVALGTFAIARDVIRRNVHHQSGTLSEIISGDYSDAAKETARTIARMSGPEQISQVATDLVNTATSQQKSYPRISTFGINPLYDGIYTVSGVSVDSKSYARHQTGHTMWLLSDGKSLFTYGPNEYVEEDVLSGQHRTDFRKDKSKAEAAKAASARGKVMINFGYSRDIVTSASRIAGQVSSIPATANVVDLNKRLVEIEKSLDNLNIASENATKEYISKTRAIRQEIQSLVSGIDDFSAEELEQANRRAQYLMGKSVTEIRDELQHRTLAHVRANQNSLMASHIRGLNTLSTEVKDIMVGMTQKEKTAKEALKTIAEKVAGEITDGSQSRIDDVVRLALQQSDLSVIDASTENGAILQRVVSQLDENVVDQLRGSTINNILFEGETSLFTRLSQTTNTLLGSGEVIEKFGGTKINNPVGTMMRVAGHTYLVLGHAPWTAFLKRIAQGAASSIKNGDISFIGGLVSRALGIMTPEEYVENNRLQLLETRYMEGVQAINSRAAASGAHDLVQKELEELEKALGITDGSSLKEELLYDEGFADRWREAKAKVSGGVNTSYFGNLLDQMVALRQELNADPTSGRPGFWKSAANAGFYSWYAGKTILKGSALAAVPVALAAAQVAGRARESSNLLYGLGIASSFDSSKEHQRFSKAERDMALRESMSGTGAFINAGVSSIGMSLAEMAALRFSAATVEGVATQTVARSFTGRIIAGGLGAGLGLLAGAEFGSAALAGVLSLGFGGLAFGAFSFISMLGSSASIGSMLSVLAVGVGISFAMEYIGANEAINRFAENNILPTLSKVTEKGTFIGKVFEATYNTAQSTVDYFLRPRMVPDEEKSWAERYITDNLWGFLSFLQPGQGMARFYDPEAKIGTSGTLNPAFYATYKNMGTMFQLAHASPIWHGNRQDEVNYLIQRQQTSMLGSPSEITQNFMHQSWFSDEHPAASIMTGTSKTPYRASIWSNFQSLSTLGEATMLQISRRSLDTQFVLEKLMDRRDVWSVDHLNREPHGPNYSGYAEDYRKPSDPVVKEENIKYSGNYAAYERSRPQDNEDNGTVGGFAKTIIGVGAVVLGGLSAGIGLLLAGKGIANLFNRLTGKSGGNNPGSPGGPPGGSPLDPGGGPSTPPGGPTSPNSPVSPVPPPPPPPPGTPGGGSGGRTPTPPLPTPDPSSGGAAKPLGSRTVPRSIVPGLGRPKNRVREKLSNIDSSTGDIEKRLNSLDQEIDGAQKVLSETQGTLDRIRQELKNVKDRIANSSSSVPERSPLVSEPISSFHSVDIDEELGLLNNLLDRVGSDQASTPAPRSRHVRSPNFPVRSIDRKAKPFPPERMITLPQGRSPVSVEISRDVLTHMVDYARKNPEVEVGSWLLGTVEQTGDSSFHIKILHFKDVGFNVKGKKEIKGTHMDLVIPAEDRLYFSGAAQDPDTGLQLLGLFHSHPTQGVFYSPPDISMHRNVFAKPYQIGIVLSSSVDGNFEDARKTEISVGGVFYYEGADRKMGPTDPGTVKTFFDVSEYATYSKPKVVEPPKPQQTSALESFLSLFKKPPGESNPPSGGRPGFIRLGGGTNVSRASAATSKTPYVKPTSVSHMAYANLGFGAPSLLLNYMAMEQAVSKEDKNKAAFGFGASVGEVVTGAGSSYAQTYGMTGMAKNLAKGSTVFGLLSLAPDAYTWATASNQTVKNEAAGSTIFNLAMLGVGALAGIGLAALGFGVLATAGLVTLGALGIGFAYSTLDDKYKINQAIGKLVNGDNAKSSEPVKFSEDRFFKSRQLANAETEAKQRAESLQPGATNAGFFSGMMEKLKGYWNRVKSAIQGIFGNDENVNLNSSVNGEYAPPMKNLKYKNDGVGYHKGHHSSFHQGQDYGAYKGTPVVASRPGTVVTNINNFGGDGKAVMVQNSIGKQELAVYGHITDLQVRPGQQVKAGQLLGYVNTDHLHMEVWAKGTYKKGIPLHPDVELQTWAREAQARGESLKTVMPILYRNSNSPVQSVDVGPKEETVELAKRIGKYNEIINRASKKYGVPVSLIKGMIATESGGNNAAVSPAGARGLMQLMPGTATDLGVKDPHNPEQNIDAGTRYIASMLKMNKGNINDALTAYNWGPGNMQAYINKGRKGFQPEEAQKYANTVLANEAKLKSLDPIGLNQVPVKPASNVNTNTKPGEPKILQVKRTVAVDYSASKPSGIDNHANNKKGQQPKDVAAHHDETLNKLVITATYPDGEKWFSLFDDSHEFMPVEYSGLDNYINFSEKG